MAMAQVGPRRVQQNSVEDRGVKCSVCSVSLGQEELEGHICLEHLDYFPYSCGHCGHFFATDVLAHFHANKKKHFPVKIREHPDMTKEQQLEQFVQAATAGETLPEPVMATERNSHSPASTPSDSLGDVTQAVDFSLDKVKTEPTEQDLEAEAKYESMVVTEEDVMFIGEVSALQAANALTEIRALFPRKCDQPKPKAKSMPDSQKDEHECNICKVVTTRNKMAHAKRHFHNQNNFACFKCDFTGKNAKSIRTHVSWKHKEVRPRDGVREVEEPVSLEHMYEACFGVKPVEKPALVEEEDEDEPLRKKRKSMASYGLGELVEVEEEERQFVNRVVQMPNGRTYKYLVCQACGMEVCDAVASIHIFQAHIQQNDMVKCSYCDYSSTYDPKSVKIHCGKKHRGKPGSVIDRRQEDDVQDIYWDWRQKCFPLLKGSNKKRSGGITSSKEAPVQTPMEEQQLEISSQEPESQQPQMLSPNPAVQEEDCPEAAASDESPLLALLSSAPVSIPNPEEEPEPEIIPIEKAKERSIRNTGGSGVSNPIQKDPWCNKCSVEVLRREVDDHVWYAHLGGVLPYRCGRCQRSFVTIEAMDSHWSSEHGRTPSIRPGTSLSAEMEVVPNQSAKAKFDEEMASCFPDLNPRPSIIIKSEPQE